MGVRVTLRERFNFMLWMMWSCSIEEILWRGLLKSDVDSGVKPIDVGVVPVEIDRLTIR